MSRTVDGSSLAGAMSVLFLMPRSPTERVPSYCSTQPSRPQSRNVRRSAVGNKNVAWQASQEARCRLVGGDNKPAAHRGRRRARCRFEATRPVPFVPRLAPCGRAPRPGRATRLDGRLDSAVDGVCACALHVRAAGTPCRCGALPASRGRRTESEHRKGARRAPDRARWSHAAARSGPRLPLHPCAMAAAAGKGRAKQRQQG